MINTLRFEYGEVRVFSNYVIVVMKEGITVKPEYNDDLVNISKEYFKDRTFGYITYRINSYGVNPMVYLKTSEIKNLVAFAVVCKDGLKTSNIEVEKRFLKQPFKKFDNLDDAKIWVLNLVQKSIM